MIHWCDKRTNEFQLDAVTTQHRCEMVAFCVCCARNTIALKSSNKFVLQCFWSCRACAKVSIASAQRFTDLKTINWWGPISTILLSARAETPMRPWYTCSTQKMLQKLSVVSFRCNKITQLVFCERKRMAHCVLISTGRCVFICCVYPYAFNRKSQQRSKCAIYVKRKITFDTIGWIEINFICSKVQTKCFANGVIDLRIRYVYG